MAPIPTAPINFSARVRDTRYFVCTDRSESTSFRFMGGYERCLPNYRILRRNFPHWIIEIIMGGQGNLDFVDSHHPLSLGSVFAYGPRIPHQFQTNPEDCLKKYFFIWGTESPPPVFHQFGFIPGRHENLAIGSDIFHWCDLILQEGQLEEQGHVDTVDNLLTILMRKLASHRSDENRTPQREKILLKAMESINRDYRRLGSLEELSQAVGVSSPYLCRIFKSHRCGSPYKALVWRKMQSAFQMLQEGDRTISDVAHSLGYDDPFHFTRVFKRHYGYSPSHLREP